MEGFVRRGRCQLTIDNSSCFVDQEETSSIVNVEWSNEKHSLYLKSMEASFVAQLQNMKDLFSWRPAGQHGTYVNLCSQGSSSGSESDEFEARKHCDKKKNNIENNPRIKCFRSETYVAPSNDANESGNMLRVLNEECSDQNFINEDAEIRAARGQRAKRLRRTRDASAAVNNDQVVPSGIMCLPIQDRMKAARLCRTER